MLWLWLAVFNPAMASPAAEPAPIVNGYTTATATSGPTLLFTDADYVLVDQYTVPAGGWNRGKAGLTIGYDRLKNSGTAPKVLWARMRFDRAALGAEPLAIFTRGNHDRIRVFLNGAEIYRDFATPADQRATWYEPILIPIPQGRLHPGVNDLTLCAISDYDVGTGPVEIGPNSVLAREYRRMYLWRIDLPRKVNFAMIMLAYGAFLYWIFGRREFQFAVIGVTSFLWFLANYSYLYEFSPFGEQVYSTFPTYFLFLAAASTLLFATEFIDLGRRKWVLTGSVAVGVSLVLLRVITGRNHLADVGVYCVATAMLGLAAGLGFRVWRRSHAVEHLILWLTMVVLTAAVVHDFGRLWYVHAWNGIGFFLQSYGGFLLCIGFLASFGRRSAVAFASLRQLNADLEARVIRAGQELAVSEAKRRELEVADAIRSERERLLREIHDGIGSNLITALRVAEQQKQPSNTIRTLRRALSDLKITIDSLEPVEGDLVALLANLRHRMENDLREAGLKCRWQVAVCRPLPWLDATNALHVLRIFQEAIGNVLAHAGANGLEIGCHEELRGGRDGLTAYVLDNGRGFDVEGPAAGRGINNMRSRARALHGVFDCTLEAGGGTRISIWLPYSRDERPQP